MNPARTYWLRGNVNASALLIFLAHPLCLPPARPLASPRHSAGRESESPGGKIFPTFFKNSVIQEANFLFNTVEAVSNRACHAKTTARWE